MWISRPTQFFHCNWCFSYHYWSFSKMASLLYHFVMEYSINSVGYCFDTLADCLDFNPITAYAILIVWIKLGLSDFSLFSFEPEPYFLLFPGIRFDFIPILFSIGPFFSYISVLLLFLFLHTFLFSLSVCVCFNFHLFLFLRFFFLILYLLFSPLFCILFELVFYFLNFSFISSSYLELLLLLFNYFYFYLFISFSIINFINIYCFF